MLSYCSKCKKNTDSVNPRACATSNGRTMILSKCVICGSKKQETKGLLSSLGIRTTLSKIPLLGDVLF